MNNEEYTQRLSKLLQAYYTAVKTGELNPQQKGRINGFMEAGLSLKAVSKHQLEEIIEQQHQKVFGRGITHKAAVQALLDQGEVDWGYFDKPVWEREG